MCCNARKPIPTAARAPRRAAVRPAHLCRGQGGRGCRCHQRGRRVTAQAPRVAQPRDRMPPRRPAEAAAEPPGRPQGPPARLFDPDIHANRRGIPCNTPDRSNCSSRA